METPLYKICFPDIFGPIASYLTDREIVNIATTNSHFAKFIKDTGVLYRHVSLTFAPLRSKKASSDELIRKFLPCIRKNPSNASMVRSLTIRHRFSGYLPHEEILYADRVADICTLCTNLTSLSLHLSNFSTGYYTTDPNIEYQKVPEGATRAFFCQALDLHIASNLKNPHVIDTLPGVLPQLRYLDWCIETRPSGLRSEDWKTSRLREELEMIHQGCPRLEHLGLLNFSDSRVSDAIIHEIANDGSVNFLLDNEDGISGIFPKLKRMTFFVGKERDAEKTLSAVVLALALARSRGIYSKIVPWCQEDANQDLILENLGDLVKIQELMEKQLDVSLDEFVNLWGNYIDARITFEVMYSAKDNRQLDLLRLFSS